MSYIQHIALFSDVDAINDREDAPLSSVRIVAIDADDAGAIQQVAAHFARENADGALAIRFKDGNPTRNQLWFLRGAGSRGDEIHAGYGRKTLYRIVPFRS